MWRPDGKHLESSQTDELCKEATKMDPVFYQ